MPSSRGSSQPRDRTCVSCGSSTAGKFFTTEPPGKPLVLLVYHKSIPKAICTHLQWATFATLYLISPYLAILHLSAWFKKRPIYEAFLVPLRQNEFLSLGTLFCACLAFQRIESIISSCGSWLVWVTCLMEQDIFWDSSTCSGSWINSSTLPGSLLEIQLLRLSLPQP